jgi:hypothetical protein
MLSRHNDNVAVRHVMELYAETLAPGPAPQP